MRHQDRRCPNHSHPAREGMQTRALFDRSLHRLGLDRHGGNLLDAAIVVSLGQRRQHTPSAAFRGPNSRVSTV